MSMKILIVDDEFEVRETLKNMLSGADFDLMFASDAITALLALKDNDDVQTIITDYRLPGLGGKDWVDILKHYHSGKNIVVISGFEIAQKLVSDKAKVVLKPFTRAQLMDAIEIKG